MGTKVIYPILVISLALTLTIILWWFTHLQVNETRVIDGSSLRATAEISQISTPFEPVIGFSLHTDKACYVVNEPIQTWVNLANLTEYSIRVLKTLRVYTGNEFQGVTPLVNGIPTKALLLAINENASNRVDDYTTLLPYESVTTHVPNFLDLVLSGELHDGQYRLSLEYKNLMSGVLKQAVLVSDTIKYEILIDQPVWTGIVTTNEAVITIVSDSKKCYRDTESGDVGILLEATRSWSR